MQYPIRILNVFMVLDRGGAETLVMNIYRNLDRSQVQFDFLVHGDKKGVYEKEILELGGRIFRMPSIGLKKLPAYLRMLKVFFAKHPEYKIIHAHNSELGLFALRQAQKSGVSCRICHAHSAPCGYGMKMFLRYLFKKITLRYITDGFACSEDAGRWQFGNFAAFQLLNNGIEVRQFQYNEHVRKELRARLKLEDYFILGHVGRFELQKNHTFLLKVFAEIVKRKSSSILLLIGEGTLKVKIEEEAEALQLSSNIMFLGGKGNVADYLQAFDVFLFPSLYEGLGISVIEAQAAGLPCFCSDTIPRQVALTKQCLFLPLDSPHVWADKIFGYSFNDRSEMNSCKIIHDSGYDIRQTTQFLESFYLDKSQNS